MCFILRLVGLFQAGTIRIVKRVHFLLREYNFFFFLLEVTNQQEKHFRRSLDVILIKIYEIIFISKSLHEIEHKRWEK